MSNENKEDKQSKDIINLAKINTNFSYPFTQYFLMNYYSSGINCCSSFILTDINNAKNKGFYIDYIHTTNDNQEEEQSITQEDKQDLADYVRNNLENNTLQQKYDDYIKMYKSKVESLVKKNTGIKYDNLNDIIKHAESTSSDIFKDYDKEKK